ncbi:putative integral membrane protein [Beutenbergia cavernae DSM 12333]|uniref:Putative integral membrane protein n=1 Tax=Beutenbergia cavernae (strain ATCC BAA-8 / DSM 12333 / CCUG 43141 / JCM 11478 / NBRC 16432 / NCIMB 13614 / HKI 0122) TaxID=471853 RepID=C5BZ56_BEUC1|nr:hypothetical protein [Beutenbergia cavernae]ACQ81171.1 putative integral membrane protein [Beutenbergia cavernae DSM 12333]
MRRWSTPVASLAIYLLTRAFTTAVLLVAAREQGPNPWAEPPPSYAEFTGLFWDAGWYHRIAVEGYPDGLPALPDGTVTQSAWAFFPLYPFLVRGLMGLTGASFEVVAPTLSLVLGAAAAVVVGMLLQERTTASLGPARARRLALGSVLLLGLFPAAPVLQMAYTESLSLLLVALSLWFLVRRWYAAAGIAIAALGFTRAVALPMAVVVAVHLWVRWRASRAGTEDFTRGAAVRVVTLGLVAVAAGFAWPVVVGVATGVPDAYLRTQEAWRGGDGVTPVLAWVDFAIRWLGGPGVLAVAVVVAGLALLVWAPRGRVVGPELVTWSGAYLLYLLGTIQPQSSTFRFLLLAFPLAATTVLLVRRRWWLPAVAVAFALAQVAWVFVLWRLGDAAGWPP